MYWVIYFLMRGFTFGFVSKRLLGKEILACEFCQVECQGIDLSMNEGSLFVCHIKTF